MTVVKTSKAIAQIYVTQMLAMVPIPEKVWVFGDQISGPFKVNSILHAGDKSINSGTARRSRTVPDVPGQLAGTYGQY